MLSTAEGDHNEHLTSTVAGTVTRCEHDADFTESGRKVIFSFPIPIAYPLDGIGDGFSVGVCAEVEFNVSSPIERHHTYPDLLRPDLESLSEVG